MKNERERDRGMENERERDRGMENERERDRGMESARERGRGMEVVSGNNSARTVRVNKIKASRTLNLRERVLDLYWSITIHR